MTSFSERYWYPPAPTTGPLLPEVARPRRLSRWPETLIVAIEMDYGLLESDWTIPHHGPVEFLDLRVDDSVSFDADRLNFLASLGSGANTTVLWRGYQDLIGSVHSRGGDVQVHRGFGATQPLSELLSDRPPTIYFLDGTVAHSATIFDSRVSSLGLPLTSIEAYAWSETELQLEARTASTGNDMLKTVHEALEEYLQAQPQRLRHRWIVGNDGKGEIADYIVIETASPADLPILSLWHAKAAGGPVGIRVTDFQEAVAQAIKSRRWLTDVGLWDLLGKRLTGQSGPEARLIEGNRMQLEVLCGVHPRFRRLSFTRRQPLVIGEISIAQPGLSKAQFENAVGSGNLTLGVRQTRDLLAVFHDSVSQIARTVRVLSSP